MAWLGKARPCPLRELPLGLGQLVVSLVCGYPGLLGDSLQGLGPACSQGVKMQQAEIQHECAALQVESWCLGILHLSVNI